MLNLDRRGMPEEAFRLHPFAPGDRLAIGPFIITTWLLPHFLPNAGVRLTAGGRTLAYTGDTGPSEDLIELARDADLFLAEATYPDEVPADAGTIPVQRHPGGPVRQLGRGRAAAAHAPVAGS